MRWVAGLLIAVGLLASGCSKDSVEPAERDAAELVNAHLRDASPKSYIAPGTTINVDKHKSDCTIGEGSTTGIKPMPAKCEWNAREESGETLVDLTEKWKCADFNERAGRPDFCQRDEASHQWFWAVTGGKDVRYLGDSGDTVAESFYLPAH